LGAIKKRNSIIFVSVAMAVGLFFLFTLSTLFPFKKNDPTFKQPFSQLFKQSEEYQFEAPIVGSYSLPTIKRAPNGFVLTHEGQKKSLSKLLKGKISLVSFVYLLCSDINGCPLAISTLFDIYDVSKKIPGLKSKAQLITISFDPERDTTEAIASFAYPMLTDKEASSKINWHVLTTQKITDLNPILKGFGQAVNRSGDGDTLFHLLRLFLVDGQGNIRNIYGLGMIDPRLIMADVETLLKEEKYAKP
jgi:protein SCO1/2